MRLRRIKWLCGMLAIIGAAGFAFAQPATSKKFAVLVGINAYKHEKLPDLKYAERDVEELAKILKPAGYDVALLTGSPSNAAHRATKAIIEQHIKDVLQKCDTGDIVVLAFAGHGLQFAESPDAYFCPLDARPFKDEIKSLVSLSEIYEQLNKSFAGMKVLLVDACRNDPDLQRGARGGIDADNAPRPPKGVAALFSCQAGERAFEAEKLQHGVFFHHVLEAFRGEAADKSGEVTFAALASHVSRRVARDVPVMIGGGAKQSPNLKADYSTEPVLMSLSNGEKEYQRGMAFLQGDPRNEAEAAKAFHAAAELGQALAQRQLGYLYLNGTGVKKDAAEAMKWFRRAADQNDALAQVNLGLIYQFGKGVPKDEGEAAKWYRKAAEKGNGGAWNQLGVLYQTGKGVAKDDAESARCFRKAADLGVAVAQRNLGAMYEEGHGVAKDVVEAAKWYRKAAEQGDAVAQLNLASMYEDGRGVAKDEAEAVKWYREAAERGDSSAQNNLGTMYETGKGVAKDEAEAVKWYRKAAAQGNDNAKRNLKRLKQSP